jgi:hypothetical protein
MTPYQPTSLVHTILALIFYLLMAGFVGYSLIALYALIRFGRSKILSLVIALLYLLISASLYAAALGSLNAIRF